MRLRALRKASGWRGWFGGTVTMANQAPKGTVDLEPMLADPPSALLLTVVDLHA
jgi:hypothetical protein